MDLFDIRSQLNGGRSIYDIPMRVTFYARVSTDKDEQLHSLSAQVKYYADFITNNPRWTLADGYVDEGLSGTSVNKREAFLRMINDAKLGRFDFIVTKEISRFSRSTLDSIKYTQDLLAAGVGVLFQSDNINTLYPDSEFRLTIMSSIAQDEVRKISERVRFGFKRAIDSGVVLGSSRIWGYVKDKGRLIIDPEEAEIIRHIFGLYANENMGIRAVCSWLSANGYKNGNGNSFSFSTVKGIISNPKYKGYYCGNKTHKYDYRRNDRKYINSSEWIMYRDEDAVPPIVSEELWDKANLILTHRSEKMSAGDKTSYQNKYPYSGKIICTEHNTPYYRTEFKYKSGSKEAWQCKLYSGKGRAACTSPIIYTSELDNIMRQLIGSVIQNKAEIVRNLTKIYSGISEKSSAASDIAKLEAEISGISKLKNKLLDLSACGRISDDEFEARNNAFNLDIASLRERISKYEHLKDFTIITEDLSTAISNELSFPGAMSAGIIESLLDRIEVRRTDEKYIANLRVHLKTADNPVEFEIRRFRYKTSVCSGQYIS